MPADICIHPWQYATDPFRIAGNLYYVGNTNVSSHLIDTGEGLILLDTAYPQTVYLLLESIRRLGFDPNDIAYILHSHAHYDHAGGTKSIVELIGAKAAIGTQDAELMRDRPDLFWANEYEVPFYEAFDVDIELEDGQAVSLGSTSVECVHSPGHTPGCMSYFFEVVDKGQKYRVGLMGGPGLNTLTDQYAQTYGLDMNPRRAAYFASLERLMRERVDIQIGAHPGQSHTFEKHARASDESNPFVNPNDWPAFLEMLRENAEDHFGKS